MKASCRLSCRCPMGAPDLGLKQLQPWEGREDSHSLSQAVLGAGRVTSTFKDTLCVRAGLLESLWCTEGGLGSGS